MIPVSNKALAPFLGHLAAQLHEDFDDVTVTSSTDSWDLTVEVCLLKGEHKVLHTHKLSMADLVDDDDYGGYGLAADAARKAYAALISMGPTEQPAVAASGLEAADALTSQSQRLKALSTRGAVAFTREQNLHKLAVEFLELALVIEHHLEGKRNRFDIALEGADVAILLDRALTLLPPGIGVPEDADWTVHRVAVAAAGNATELFLELEGKEAFLNPAGTLSALDFLRHYVGEENWTRAMSLKLDKAEDYVSEREALQAFARTVAT